jgi:lipopolysaccharide biosynthesis regulator YciM
LRSATCFVRRRGETERAIRMHQNLLELPEVEDKHRLQAMVELVRIS